MQFLLCKPPMSGSLPLSWGAFITELHYHNYNKNQAAWYVPEHAGATMFICSRVLLQRVGGRLQLVNEVWIEYVELVPLHNLNSTARQVMHLSQVFNLSLDVTLLGVVSCMCLRA